LLKFPNTNTHDNTFNASAHPFSGAKRDKLYGTFGKEKYAHKKPLHVHTQHPATKNETQTNSKCEWKNKTGIISDEDDSDSIVYKKNAQSK